MDHLNEKRRNLDGFCLDAISFVSDIVKKIKQSFQDKLDGFIYSFIDQIRLQQKNFTVVINESYFDKIFVQLKEQIKNKIDTLSNLQQQINDLNAVIMVQTLVKPNQGSGQQYTQETEQFNNNRLQLQDQKHIDYRLFDQKEFGQHKALNSPDEWLRHLIYTCQVCDQVLVGLLTYRSHTKSQHDVKYTYKCQFCDTLFTITTDFATHLFKQHFNQDKSKKGLGGTVFVCPYTKMEFSCQGKLAKHILRTLQYHAQVPDNFFKYVKKKVEEILPSQNSINEEQPDQEEKVNTSTKLL